MVRDTGPGFFLRKIRHHYFENKNNVKIYKDKIFERMNDNAITRKYSNCLYRYRSDG